eukprot:191862_1
MSYATKHNRLASEYGRQKQRQMQYNQIFNADNVDYDEYINEYSDYYYDDDADSSYYFEEFGFEDVMFGVEPRDDIATYLEAPGYSVKMNEKVFEKYLLVLQEIFGTNKNGKFGDGKAEIEELRLALKEEAQWFVNRPKTKGTGHVRKKFQEHKWEIVKSGVGMVPVIGKYLKVLLTAIEHAPEAKQILQQKWKQRALKKEGFYQLDEGLQTGHGEPFNIYILQHWMPPDMLPEPDINSICDVNLPQIFKFPSRPQLAPYRTPDIDELAPPNPGKCVYQQSIDVTEDKAPCNRAMNVEECFRLRNIEQKKCQWQYCMKIAGRVIEHAEPWKGKDEVSCRMDIRRGTCAWF